jgi:hypothetical protein
LIAHSPIEWRVEAIYPLSDVVSSGVPHAGLYISVSSKSRSVIAEVKKLFLGNDGRKIIVQKNVPSLQKESQNHKIAQFVRSP